MTQTLPAIGVEVPQSAGLPPIGAEVSPSVQAQVQVATPRTPATPDKPSSYGAIVGRGVASTVPIAERAALEFATSPTAAKTGGVITKAVTTAGAVAHGIYSGNPTEVIAAPMEGWAAGKGGYFLTKGLQSTVATPTAKVLQAVAPYLQTLSTLSGAQGALDLAQIAEPKRTDIGVMGMSMSNQRTDAEKEAHPALLNQIFHALVSKGLTAGEAVHAILFASHAQPTKP